MSGQGNALLILREILVEQHASPLLHSVPGWDVAPAEFGTILFIVSMVTIGFGALSHYMHCSSSVYLSLFVYGSGIFFLSAIVLFIGVLFAAKSGKLQKRASEIWNNKPKKNKQ
ncbi:MAG: hypothetical protein QXN26_06585 [Thermoplasmataceae archaeon]